MGSPAIVRAAVVGIALSVVLAGIGVSGAGATSGLAEGAGAPTAGHAGNAVGSPTGAGTGADGVGAVDRTAANDGENETDDDDNETDAGVDLPPPEPDSSVFETTAVGSLSSCTDVTSSGVYTIGGDLTGTDPVCMNVTASDVVIDGQGNTIDAAGGVGIRVDGGGTTLTNVTVRNVTVTNGTIGVRFGSSGDPVDDSAIRGVNASGHSDYGIQISAGRNVVIADSLIGDNDVYGLELDGFDGPISNVSILGTDVSGNDGEGIYVQTADDTVIRDVTATDNDDENVEVDDSLRVVLDNVTATGAADLDGIEFDDSPNATLVDVVASGNGDDSSDAGLDVDQSPNSTFDNVVADRNTAEGMVISQSDNVTVTGSSAGGNDVGIRVFDASGVEIVDTAVTGNADRAIEVVSPREFTEEPRLLQESLSGTYATGKNVDVGTATVGFGPSRDFAIGAAPSPPDRPQGLVGVDQYLFATNISPDGFVDLQVTYSDADAGGVMESTLALYHYNETETRWFEVDGSGVDSGANTVSANVTSFSTIAPFGEALLGGARGGEDEPRGDASDGEQYACDHPHGSDQGSGERPRDCDA